MVAPVALKQLEAIRQSHRALDLRFEHVKQKDRAHGYANISEITIVQQDRLIQRVLVRAAEDAAHLRDEVGSTDRSAATGR